MLDQKIRNRIFQDSENYYRDSEVGQSVIKTFRYGYVAGGEAEAERAQGLVEGLVEALEKIVDLAIKMGEDATEIWAIADGALTKHADYKNNSK